MYRTVVVMILVAAMLTGVAFCPTGAASCVDSRCQGKEFREPCRQDVSCARPYLFTVWNPSLQGGSFTSWIINWGFGSVLKFGTSYNGPAKVQTPPGRYHKYNDRPETDDFTWDENKK